GDDGDGMAKLPNHFQNRTGYVKSPLDRLIRIGAGADIDRLAHIARLSQLPLQQLRRVLFVEELGLEVEARRKVDGRVRRARKAINASMLASPVRIDRLIERYIR